jgi:hypothetical protein
MLPPSILPFRPCANSGLAGGKNLERKLLGLEALQPLEIPQIRERIVWKSLERMFPLFGEHGPGVTG